MAIGPDIGIHEAAVVTGGALSFVTSGGGEDSSLHLHLNIPFALLQIYDIMASKPLCGDSDLPYD